MLHGGVWGNLCLLCYPRRLRIPSIAIVGPGRLGSALAKHLHSASYPISEIICRDRGSLRRARALARVVRAAAATLQTSSLAAEVVWFCVPDSQIEAAASALATRSWKGKIAVHSSGVLTSGALAGLREAGASVASAHPLMTFIRGSVPELTSVPFAMEGDLKAVQSVKGIVRNLGARPVPIREQDKAAYHMFATVVCPMMVSLLAASEEAAKLAHVPPHEARHRMLPIIRQTISNYEKFGGASAFTGPFVRGDVETVRLHLKALSRHFALREVYVWLAEAALRNLPHRNASEIRAVLKG